MSPERETLCMPGKVLPLGSLAPMPSDEGEMMSLVPLSD